ncbi:MAG: twitching motility protein PilT [Candidatus Omnitrophica bacterium]|nr:twitching motility protein PilT [Candidatus Omnitrophota bacterium]
MTLLFIRIFFLVLSAVIGYLIGNVYEHETLGILIALAAASLLMLIEIGMKSVSVRGLSSVVFGLLFGVVMAKLIADTISLVPMSEAIMASLRVVLTLMFSYIGAVIALRGKDEFNLIIPYVRFRRTDLKDGVVVLDTSAIIDSRVFDIYRTHFLSGRLVVPRFVLHELQRLADSEDDMKRQRGRRGLELLRTMQKDTGMDIRVNEDDPASDEPAVDLKLIKLAKVLEARLCTTDFNLSRMAAIQGVDVVNVNDLVNAVKPVIFAGEELDVQIVKEGKEDNQGVGYLEDGTMVVVTEGRKHMGQRVKAVVTSVLQTQAGRMIFAKTGGR